MPSRDVTAPQYLLSRVPRGGQTITWRDGYADLDLDLDDLAVECGYHKADVL
jgi:hypothetical protein